MTRMAVANRLAFLYANLLESTQELRMQSGPKQF